MYGFSPLLERVTERWLQEVKLFLEVLIYQKNVCRLTARQFCFHFKFFSLYHHDITEMVNKYDASSDNTEEDGERDGAAKAIDRFKYFMKENISVEKLNILFQV